MKRLIIPRRALLKAGAAALITSPAIIRKAAAQVGGLSFPGPGPIQVTGGGSYAATAVSFTGTQHLDAGSALTGAVDGPAGILSFWFNMTGADSTFQVFQETASGSLDLTIYRTNTNIFDIQGHNSATTLVMRMTSSTAYSTITNPGWHHLLASWNTATGTGANFLYIDDVSVISTNSVPGGNLNYSAGTTNLFARSGGSIPVNADVAEFYVNYATNLDLSITANRRKFVSASIHPVDMGIDGSTPTGTAPILWFSANNTYSGQNVGTGGATWATNKGSGGALTKTGTLAAAATNP